MPTYKKKNESSLVTNVGQYLQVLENLHVIAFWSRQQAGTLQIQRLRQVPGGGTKAFWQAIRLGRKGISDLWVILHQTLPPGRLAPMVWIECKTEEGAQNEDQKIFQKIVESAGHYYWVIRSCDELEQKFKEIGILRAN